MGYSNLITRCYKAPKSYFLSPFFVLSTNIYAIEIIITQLFQYCQQYTRRKKYQKRIEICHGSIKKNNSKHVTLLNLFTIYLYIHMYSSALECSTRNLSIPSTTNIHRLAGTLIFTSAFSIRQAICWYQTDQKIFLVKFLHWEIPLPILRLISPWAAIPSAFVCLQKPIAHVRGLSQTFIKTLLVWNGDEQPSKERKRKAEGRKKGSKFHVRDRLRSHSEKRSCSARLKKEGKLAENA